MKSLRIILIDQLTPSISALEDINKFHDVILMCEHHSDLIQVKHHKKKLAFWLSAMRHFAEELTQQDYNLIYRTLDGADNLDCWPSEIKRLQASNHFDRLIITSPSDYSMLQSVQSWSDQTGLRVDIRPDNRFICSPERFKSWASGRKSLRMEFFYRQMRQDHHILMQGDQPEGGQWNFDADNRKPPKIGLQIPHPYQQSPDAITQKVMALVSERFSDHFGDLEPFYFAVTQAQAQEVLTQFIEQRLKQFGDYQDAMLMHEPWMFHAHISFYLNIGLLLPQTCIQQAEAAYQQGKAPLNAVEGFIRQILGWREYVRGIYWLKMPEYQHLNYFDARRALPDFFWHAQTDMNCLKQCVSETKQHAYAHHIQRLMVLGNFCLLAGINPDEVNEWYWIVYADAYQWVELPNVTGMILFADGGYLASKPYAAGGNYIHKMSNYCQHCRYHVKEKTGPDACPFNYLYWDFLVRNRDKLKSNPRISMMLKTYDRMEAGKQKAIAQSSQDFFDHLS
ncbi:MAG: cryptochrome/photolyase family protein [Pseudomonadota bacterium]|nr:cryptochrome/photolyase family protein [Pseudomonadota bacterium]